MTEINKKLNDNEVEVTTATENKEVYSKEMIDAKISNLTERLAKWQTMRDLL